MSIKDVVSSLGPSIFDSKSYALALRDYLKTKASVLEEVKTYVFDAFAFDNSTADTFVFNTDLDYALVPTVLASYDGETFNQVFTDVPLLPARRLVNSFLRASDDAKDSDFLPLADMGVSGRFKVKDLIHALVSNVSLETLQANLEGSTDIPVPFDVILISTGEIIFSGNQGFDAVSNSYSNSFLVEHWEDEASYSPTSDISDLFIDVTQTFKLLSIAANDNLVITQLMGILSDASSSHQVMTSLQAFWQLRTGSTLSESMISDKVMAWIDSAADTATSAASRLSLIVNELVTNAFDDDIVDECVYDDFEYALTFCPSRYSGSSAFSLWSASSVTTKINGVCNSTASLIKSGIKVVGSVIKGLISPVKSVWRKSVKPIYSDNCFQVTDDFDIACVDIPSVALKSIPIDTSRIADSLMNKESISFTPQPLSRDYYKDINCSWADKIHGSPLFSLPSFSQWSKSVSSYVSERFTINEIVSEAPVCRFKVHSEPWSEGLHTRPPRNTEIDYSSCGVYIADSNGAAMKRFVVQGDGAIHQGSYTPTKTMYSVDDLSSASVQGSIVYNCIHSCMFTLNDATFSGYPLVRISDSNKLIFDLASGSRLSGYEPSMENGHLLVFDRISPSEFKGVAFPVSSILDSSHEVINVPQSPYKWVLESANLHTINYNLPTTTDFSKTITDAYVSPHSISSLLNQYVEEGLVIGDLIRSSYLGDVNVSGRTLTQEYALVFQDFILIVKIKAVFDQTQKVDADKSTIGFSMIHTALPEHYDLECNNVTSAPSFSYSSDVNIYSMRFQFSYSWSSNCHPVIVLPNTPVPRGEVTINVIQETSKNVQFAVTAPGYPKLQVILDAYDASCTLIYNEVHVVYFKFTDVAEPREVVKPVQCCRCGVQVIWMPLYSSEAFITDSLSVTVHEQLGVTEVVHLNRTFSTPTYYSDGSSLKFKWINDDFGDYPVFFSVPISEFSDSLVSEVSLSCLNALPLGMCASVDSAFFSCEMIRSSDSSCSLVVKLKPVGSHLISSIGLSPSDMNSRYSSDDYLARLSSDVRTLNGSSPDFKSDDPEYNDVAGYRGLALSIWFTNLILTSWVYPDIMFTDFISTPDQNSLFGNLSRVNKVNASSVTNADFINSFLVVNEDSSTCTDASTRLICSFWYNLSLASQGVVKWYYLAHGVWPEPLPVRLGLPLGSPKYHVQTDDELAEYAENAIAALIVGAAVLAVSGVALVTTLKVRKSLTKRYERRASQANAIKHESVSAEGELMNAKNQADSLRADLKKLDKSSPEWMDTKKRLDDQLDLVKDLNSKCRNLASSALAARKRMNRSGRLLRLFGGSPSLEYELIADNVNSDGNFFDSFSTDSDYDSVKLSDLTDTTDAMHSSLSKEITSVGDTMADELSETFTSLTSIQNSLAILHSNDESQNSSLESLHESNESQSKTLSESASKNEEFNTSALLAIADLGVKLGDSLTTLITKERSDGPNDKRI